MQNKDPRSDEMKREMAEHFERMEADYRDTEGNYTGSEVVYEDEEIVVIADHTGHELSEWIQDFDVESRAFRQCMHELARQVCDYDWSVSDPVVFDKMEGNGA